MVEQLKRIPLIADANSDEQNHGLQAVLDYDRNTAARFGISPQLIDTTLNDAFAQRQVSTMYTSLNQYHVVMEAAGVQARSSPYFCARSIDLRPPASMVPLSRFH